MPPLKQTLMLLTAIAFSTIGSNAWADLITNGDFELGDTGFTSNYTFTPNHPPVSGIHGIDDDPNDWFPNLASFGDHTTGSGLLFVGDGGPVTDNLVLEYLVPLSAGQAYRFSGFFAEPGGGESTSQQLFDFRVEGASIGMFDLTGEAVGDYVEVSQIFTADATNATASFSIHALRTDPIGNNFVIDDLSLTAVPEPTSLAVLGMVAVGVMTRRRR